MLPEKQKRQIMCTFLANDFAIRTPSSGGEVWCIEGSLLFLSELVLILHCLMQIPAVRGSLNQPDRPLHCSLDAAEKLAQQLLQSSHHCCLLAVIRKPLCVCACPSPAQPSESFVQCNNVCLMEDSVRLCTSSMTDLTHNNLTDSLRDTVPKAVSRP